MELALKNIARKLVLETERLTVSNCKSFGQSVLGSYLTLNVPLIGRVPGLIDLTRTDFSTPIDSPSIAGLAWKSTSSLRALLCRRGFRAAARSTAFQDRRVDVRTSQTEVHRNPLSVRLSPIPS